MGASRGIRRLYKLTDANMRTYGGFRWALDEWQTASGKGELCGPGWFHCYTSPELAVLLNPIHAAFAKPRLFVAQGRGAFLDDRGLKVGVAQCRLVEERELPTYTTAQRTAFGILCAQAIYSDSQWQRWATGWLAEKDRSRVAADAAAAKKKCGFSLQKYALAARRY